MGNIFACLSSEEGGGRPGQGEAVPSHSEDGQGQPQPPAQLPAVCTPAQPPGCAGAPGEGGRRLDGGPWPRGDRPGQTVPPKAPRGGQRDPEEEQWGHKTPHEPRPDRPGPCSSDAPPPQSEAPALGTLALGTGPRPLCHHIRGRRATRGRTGPSVTSPAHHTLPEGDLGTLGLSVLDWGKMDEDDPGSRGQSTLAWDEMTEIDLGTEECSTLTWDEAPEADLWTPGLSALARDKVPEAAWATPGLSARVLGRVPDSDLASPGRSTHPYDTAPEAALRITARSPEARTCLARRWRADEARISPNTREEEDAAWPEGRRT